MIGKEMLLQFPNEVEVQNELLKMPPQETGFEGLYLGHNFWNTYSESLSDFNRFYENNDRDADKSIENHMIEYASRRNLLLSHEANMSREINMGREAQKTVYESFDMRSECNIGRNIKATHRAVADNLWNKTAQLERFFGKGYQITDPDQARHQMIKLESDLVGSKLFGAVPKEHKREFYCLDENIWVWYEQWKEYGERQSRMVRYEVSENQVTKNIDGMYKKVGEAELANLRQAIHLYYTEIMHKIYRVDPYTGRALA